MRAVSEAADNPVRNLVLAVHRHLLRRVMGEAAGAGVLLAGAMALAGRMLLPQAGHLDAILWGVMVGAAFAMVRYVSRRPEALTAAIVCDQAAGTPELFSTAWSLPHSGQPDPAWQQAILAQAAHALSRVDVASILHGRTRLGRLIVGLMLLLSATLWPGEAALSGTHSRDQQTHASDRFASMDVRDETAGSAAWPAPALRPSPSVGETSRTGGPELLTPADAGAKVDTKARRLGEESGFNASVGRGAGAGLAKGGSPSPLDMAPGGKRPSAGATAGLIFGDGTASHRVGKTPAGSAGRVAVDAGPAAVVASVSGNSAAPAGPAPAEIASTPAAYRAAVREYFNR